VSDMEIKRSVARDAFWGSFPYCRWQEVPDEVHLFTHVRDLPTNLSSLMDIKGRRCNFPDNLQQAALDWYAGLEDTGVRGLVKQRVAILFEER